VKTLTKYQSRAKLQNETTLVRITYLFVGSLLFIRHCLSNFFLEKLAVTFITLSILVRFPY
jgi:hypothetical protein